MSIKVSNMLYNISGMLYKVSYIGYKIFTKRDISYIQLNKISRLLYQNLIYYIRYLY